MDEPDAHTDALRVMRELLEAVRSDADDAAVRGKSEELHRLLAAFVEQFRSMSNSARDTHAGALDDVLLKYERLRAVEDSASDLLKGLLDGKSA
jgi:hypothetical protein